MDQFTINLLFVGASFALYIGIAVWARAGSTSEFYAAGRGVHPFATTKSFWQLAARPDQAGRHRGFILHTVTRLHRPRLTHYYGIICHLTPHRSRLELPLAAAYSHLTLRLWES